MWIFGYGSLMWDGWENRFACHRRIDARLNGYARSFTKASVRNWGTPNSPGPTLSLIESSGSHCDGVAFEFSDTREDEVLQYLREREGKNFKQISREIFSPTGEVISATLFNYGGKNVIAGKSTDDIAGMILSASGTDGSALDYLTNCKKHLDALGIVDVTVDDTWAAVLARKSNTLIR